MRALADFIMRGRTQAATVALIGHWVPFLTAAAVALVTLRRGLKDGVQVLLWGLLPAIVMLALSQQSAWMAINGAVAVFAAAAVLGHFGAWRQALMGLVSLNILGAVLLALWAPTLVADWSEQFGKFFTQLQNQSDHTLQLPEPGSTFVLGFIAAITAYSGAAGLVIGRWWQAMLYNPGGFAEEFHRLRLGPVEALVCLGAALYAWWQPGGYSVWMALFALPLLFAGLALVHALAARRGLATGWLVAFYLALFVLQPLAKLLVLVAFVDTWLDFRGRTRSQT